MRMQYLKNTPFGTFFLRSGVFNLCIYLLRVTFLWEHKIHFSALRQLYLFNATSSRQNTSLVPQMKVILKSTELLQLLSSCCRRKQTATSAECWGQGGDAWTHWRQVKSDLVSVIGPTRHRVETNRSRWLKIPWTPKRKLLKWGHHLFHNMEIINCT